MQGNWKHVCMLFFFCLFLFLIRVLEDSLVVVQGDLELYVKFELLIFLPSLFNFWDDMCVPACPTIPSEKRT